MIGGINIEFEKNKSLEVSENFFKKLESKLEKSTNKINGYYKVFNNCREQGYVLTIMDKSYDDDLLIWACECRNTDQIMIIMADRTCSDVNDMFDDKAYKTAKYFKYEDYDSAVDYVFKAIRKQFKKYFLEEMNYKFKMHKCMDDIEKIQADASNLDYEDYYDIVTFENEDNGYFCDLIIMDGKMGLRYSRYCNPYHDELDNLSFEEWNPDLTSEITLMLGMQNKLNDFVEKEEEYEIEIGNEMKI